MNDSRLFLLLPLLLLSDQAVSELVFALSLLRAVCNSKATFAARDVVFKNIRRNVLLLLSFAQCAKSREELGLFLGGLLGRRPRAKGTAEIGRWLGRWLWFGRDARLR